jgi:hypothetical protein
MGLSSNSLLPLSSTSGRFCRSICTLSQTAMLNNLKHFIEKAIRTDWLGKSRSVSAASNVERMVFK